MGVDVHGQAADDADQTGEPDTEHRHSDPRDQIGVEAADRRGALALRFERRVDRDDAAIEDPDRTEDEYADEWRPDLPVEGGESLDD